MLPTGKCSNAADFEVCPRVLRLPSLCFPLGGPPPPRPLPTWREIQFSQTRRHDRRKGATLGLCRGVEEHIPVTVIDILINFFLKFISLSKSCKWERMVRVLTRYGSRSGTYVWGTLLSSCFGNSRALWENGQQQGKWLWACLTHLRKLLAASQTYFTSAFEPWG